MRLDSLGNRPARNVTANRLSGSRSQLKTPCQLLLVLALMLAGSSQVPAASFDELYTVSIEPDPALTGQQQRNDAIRRGMLELVTRITGRRRSLDEPGIAALVASADSYYNAYSPLAGEIRISYLRSQVNDALTRLNEPIWPDERPLTLIWLAVDFGDGQRAELGSTPESSGYRPDQLQLLSPDGLSDDAAAVFDAAVNELLDVADERGLPVVLPRLDGVDRQIVRFADVWGGFDRFVERAAERYEADAILIPRLGMSAAGPELRWILRRGDIVETFSSSAVRAGIDRLADQFAGQFAVSGDMRQIWLTIRNIRTWPDYGRVDEYLRSVSIVNDVFIRSWSTEGELLLRIDSRGDEDRLSQILALGGTLLPWLPGEAEAGLPQPSGALVFVPQWLDDTADGQR